MFQFVTNSAFACRLIAIMLLVLVSAMAVVPATARDRLDNLQQRIADQIRPKLVLTQAEQEWLRNNPEIRLGFDESFGPYTFLGNQGYAEGLAVDYLDIVAHLTGMEILPLQGLGWKGVLEAGRQGNLDVIATGIRTPAREKDFVFSRFSIPTPWVIFTRQATQTQRDDPADLRQGVVALVRDYAVSEKVVSEYPDINVQWHDNPAEALQALASGEADSYVGVLGVATHLAQNLGLSNLVVVGRFDLQPGGQRYLLPKDKVMLRDIIDKVLDLVSGKDRVGLQSQWLPSISTRLSGKQGLRFTEAEQRRLAPDQQITMCVDPDWMPYEKIDVSGKHIGIAADYIAMFSEMIGKDITLVPTQTWQESENRARARECDILSFLNYSDKRAEFLNFTDPFVEAPLVLVTREDVTYLDGLQAMSGKTLATVEGYVYGDLIAEQYPDIDIVYLENMDEILQAVSRGDVYATVGSLYILTTQIQRLGLSDLKIAGHTEFTNRFRIGVRNDDPVLLSILSKAVNARDARAENDILQRWISVRLETGTDYILIFQILGGAGLILAFLVYRHIVARRHNTILQEKNAVLEQLSRVDSLTGIANRMRLDESLREEMERARRYRHGLSVVLFDIDHFKYINDTHGHQAGDKVLKALADLVQEQIRQTDVFGRWGGEEFLIVCPETRSDTAKMLAEKLRDMLYQQSFKDVGRVTASFGIASWTEGDQFKDVISRADQALYRAKAGGRNRVES